MTSIGDVRLLTRRDKKKITFGNDESVIVDAGYTPHRITSGPRKGQRQSFLEYVAEAEIGEGTDERPGDGYIYAHRDPGNHVMNRSYGRQVWATGQDAERVPESVAARELGEDFATARRHGQRLAAHSSYPNYGAWKWENMTRRDQDIATEFVHNVGSGRGTGYPKAFPNLKRHLEDDSDDLEQHDEDVFLESRRDLGRRNRLFYERYYGIPVRADKR